MRILVIDIAPEQEKYSQAFGVHNYEDNNLMFCGSFHEGKEFLTNQLEAQKNHVDAILVGNRAYSDGGDSIKASELLAFKNMLTGSYSGGNFRVCAIPMILITDELPNTAIIQSLKFDAVVEKNHQGDYTDMIEATERVIRSWRQQLQYDLDELSLLVSELQGFSQTNGYEEEYMPRVGKNAEMFFVQHTKVVSMEFIKCPGELEYDWLTSSVAIIESQVIAFGKGYRHHKPYNRKDNENTILHPLLMQNPAVLLRDNYASFLHERSFPESAQLRKRPDFILQPAIPEYMDTELLEVKKEDVQLLKGKSKKNKLPSAYMTEYFIQLHRYRKFAEDDSNESIVQERLGFKPSRFKYVLLAGRAEEKDKHEEVLKELIDDHYSGLQLVSYEDMEQKGINYLERFDRMVI